MEKGYQLIIGGFILWAFILLQYGFRYLVGLPGLHYGFPVLIAIISLPFFITGVFLIKKYYNKFIYLVSMLILSLFTLILVYLNISTVPYPVPVIYQIIIGESLFILVFILFIRDFLREIDKSKKI